MQTQAQRAAVPVFALTMFFSAALIFVLQPMFARMTTPLLGGSPAVWNTSMVFFQGALLVGYAYAHALARLQSLRTQVIIHGLVLAAGCIALPITVSAVLGAPNSAAPIAWLFGVLALSVGLPYAAASATAPLLQAWFARTGRPDAGDPYYLYAASNLGSLGGLIAYPVLLEPTLGLSVQRIGWSGAYVGLIVFVVLAGLLAMACRGPAVSAPQAAADAPSRSLWKDRLYWMAAAAVPSSLLLGVTTHISTDVASAPFLWVAPLALYLLTFVLAFARNTQGLRPAAVLLLPIALGVLLFTFSHVDFTVTLAAHLVGFFLAALVCHFALAARRPDASRLTEFYMWVSTGGVVGGALTALLAPVIFNDVYEYPLALAAVGLFLPRGSASLSRMLSSSLMLLVAAAASLVLVMGFDLFSESGALVSHDELILAGAIALLGGLAIAGAALPQIAMALAVAAIGGLGILTYLFTQQQYISTLVLSFALGMCASAIFANRGQPALVAALVLVAFAMIRIDRASGTNVVFQERSFFGVTRVTSTQLDRNDPNSVVRVMVHGTTTHGAQYVSGPRATEPLTYYNPKTGLGHATLRGIAQFDSAHLGLIGLGSGSTACLLRPQDRLTIYEIDPKVVRMSNGSGIFTFVPRCAPKANVVIGDARLSVAKEPDASLDVIVVDAFSSDAVPAHLLTREAIRGYIQKLSPKGVVILHLSNRNLDLLGEASRVASEEGLGARWANTDSDTSFYDVYATTVMVLGRTQATVDALDLGPTWLVPDQYSGRAWSDDYVNFVRPLLAQMAP